MKIAFASKKLNFFLATDCYFGFFHFFLNQYCYEINSKSCFFNSF
ncbi:hypothetical protein NU08_3537 [Flavobacterium anhuiense]|uniref:Uncharacterized protein n=1 Tax=Flavobacterium anhuiense TaxID=459526 RepID=A0A444VV55_9FLAO|nr:hypothetical protein NU08_3537 [Flavobacterium anhuiense]